MVHLLRLDRKNLKASRVLVDALNFKGIYKDLQASRVSPIAFTALSRVKGVIQASRVMVHSYATLHKFMERERCG